MAGDVAGLYTQVAIHSKQEEALTLLLACLCLCISINELQTNFEAFFFFLYKNQLKNPEMKV